MMLIRSHVVSILTCTLLVLGLPGRVSTAADLKDLAGVVERSSFRASSYDRTGGNNDNVTSFEPGKTHVLLDTDGPGIITHCWLTVSNFPGHPAVLRDLVLRMYWENSEVPSVEVPLGDFFGLGHGKLYTVRSQPINVGADPRALNCYWPMPFYKHARIEIFNNGRRSIRRIYYNIDYELGPIPPQQGLFHAEFRSIKDLPAQALVANTTGQDNYVILDTKGKGHYVGCFLFVDSAPGGWWGEGDEMMFIDGEKKPSIVGTGTEDYFCEAWGFDGVTGFPYYGVPYMEKQTDGWTQTSVYRFHVPDPVRFGRSLRVTIEHGWKSGIVNDYSSVAYWYQLSPCTTRPALPSGPEANLRPHDIAQTQTPKSVKISAPQAEAALRSQGISARAITTSYGATYRGGYLQIDAPGKSVDIPVTVPAPGKYNISVRLYPLDANGPVTLSLKGKPSQTVERVAREGTIFDLGEVEVGDDASFIITTRSTGPMAIDFISAKVITP